MTELIQELSIHHAHEHVSVSIHEYDVYDETLRGRERERGGERAADDDDGIRMSMCRCISTRMTWANDISKRMGIFRPYKEKHRPCACACVAPSTLY